MYIDAERLRACRVAANLSLRDLAELCNISKSALANFEYSHRQPKIEAVRAIASALNVSVEYLTGESDVKTPTPTEELDEGRRLWLELYDRISEDSRDFFVTLIDAFEHLPEEEQKKRFAAIQILVQK